MSNKEFTNLLVQINHCSSSASEQAELILKIKESGVEINRKDNGGASMLVVACENNFDIYHVVNYLLSQNAGKNNKDELDECICVATETRNYLVLISLLNNCKFNRDIVGFCREKLRRDCYGSKNVI